MSDEFGFGNLELIEEEVDILLIGGGMACCRAVSPRRMPSTNKSCPICIGPCNFVPIHGPAHYRRLFPACSAKTQICFNCFRGKDPGAPFREGPSQLTADAFPAEVPAMRPNTAPAIKPVPPG